MKSRFVCKDEGSQDFEGVPDSLHCNFIGALIAIGTAIAAKKSADKQAGISKAALKQQGTVEDRQTRIAEAQEGRARELYNDYRTTYEPRQRQLVQDAFEGDLTSPEAAAARATADVRKATANAQEIRDRGARRLGVDPSSGAYAATARDIDVGNAALEASERGFARRETRDSNFGRQTQVLGMGQGLPATAGGLSGSAAGILGNVNASVTRRLERSQDLEAAAGQAFGGALAQGVGSLFGSWGGGARTLGGAGSYTQQAGLAGVS